MSLVGLVRCLHMPEPDPDEAILLSACKGAGLTAEWVSWDDPAVQWGGYSVLVVRSTWDYYERPFEFLKWAAHAGSVSKLWNPYALIERTIDKRYLRYLEREGIPIVPTSFYESGEICPTLPSGPIVIKPTISAGSYRTERFEQGNSAEARKFLDDLLLSQGAMVQPYLRSVESGGEISLVFIDGEQTHSIVKQPRFADQDEQVALSPTPDLSAQALAARVVAKIEEPWLYARVDLMRADNGEWLLSELEVIEPSLFLLQHPLATERLVQAIGRLV